MLLTSSTAGPVAYDQSMYTMAASGLLPLSHRPRAFGVLDCDRPKRDISPSQVFAGVCMKVKLSCLL